MILYDLKCARGHVFEAWFRDSASFDKQKSRRQVTCPTCGDSTIEKAPMAPRIGRGKDGAGKPATNNGRQAKLAHMLAELRQHVETTCDYVGERFPEEARRIHYGETEERGIYGEATTEEARDLHDEGVPVRRLPLVPRHES